MFQSSIGVVVKFLVKDLDDDECVILDGDPDKPVDIKNNGINESDDLLVVGENGQVACRDYPHPRYLCANFPFSSTPHKRHCDLCHCYICDSLAPCFHWGMGISFTDHCNATNKGASWKLLRKSWKNKDKAPLSVTTSNQSSPTIFSANTELHIPQSGQTNPISDFEINCDRAKNSQLQCMGSMGEMTSFVTQFDGEFNGSANTGSLGLKFENWRTDNQFNLCFPEVALMDPGGKEAS
ncbi:hypothetical protein LguiA_020573 [Lonicera macranthoides]